MNGYLLFHVVSICEVIISFSGIAMVASKTSGHCNINTGTTLPLKTKNHKLIKIWL